MLVLLIKKKQTESEHYSCSCRIRDRALYNSTDPLAKLPASSLLPPPAAAPAPDLRTSPLAGLFSELQT